MTDEPDLAAPPAGGPPGVPGWFPDPWSSTLLRWWTGESWTFSTMPAAPPPAVPVPAAPSPPTSSAPPTTTPPPPPPPPPTAAVTSTGGRRVRSAGLLVGLLLLGLVAGLLAVGLLRDPGSPTVAAPDSPGTSVDRDPSPAPTTPRLRPPTTVADPAGEALFALVVVPADVAPSLTVGLLPGGDGLSQPTLDLCNGTYPSEARRQARLQDVVLDEQALVTFSTEAVLYADPAAAAQALAEVRDVVAACPPTPVVSPNGGPTLTTRFDAAPDGDWPQTDGVNRVAFDLTTTDETGQTNHSYAVYLQRGRVLLGVYFPDADRPPTEVAGQTTVPEIVAEFAGRLADLPAAVVGS